MILLHWQTSCENLDFYWWINAEVIFSEPSRKKLKILFHGVVPDFKSLRNFEKKSR